MKSLVALLLFSPAAFAGTSIDLPTPHTIAMTTPVTQPRCSASAVITSGYATTVTGFSADGNYVLGQVAAYFTCGSSGRGGTLHTYWNCAQLSWDLGGNLISATVSVATVNSTPISSYCPAETLNMPSRTPPSSTVVGNEFTNSGGYIAETVLEQVCGSSACPSSWLYYLPTLLTP